MNKGRAWTRKKNLTAVKKFLKQIKILKIDKDI